jgi:energy-converting hydrogenase Eha subunit C
VSYLTALIFTFVAFTVGGLAWLLASPPMALVYLAVFGSAFVAAFSRSRFLPRAAIGEFLVPVVFSLILLVASGWAGIWTAHFLNDTLFHIPEKEFHP